jgi:hypothetical protein
MQAFTKQRGGGLLVADGTEGVILKKSVEFSPAENIQHKLDKLAGAMFFI